MRQLSGQRGWEHAYKKGLDEALAMLRKDLEERAEGRELAQFQYLCGQIRGIREAIEILEQTWKDYRLDNDADLAS